MRWTPSQTIGLRDSAGGPERSHLYRKMTTLGIAAKE